MKVLSIKNNTFTVAELEVLDQTPVIDIKPVIQELAMVVLMLD